MVYSSFKRLSLRNKLLVSPTKTTSFWSAKRLLPPSQLWYFRHILGMKVKMCKWNTKARHSSEQCWLLYYLRERGGVDFLTDSSTSLHFAHNFVLVALAINSKMHSHQRKILTDCTIHLCFVTNMIFFSWCQVFLFLFPLPAAKWSNEVESNQTNQRKYAMNPWDVYQ